MPGSPYPATPATWPQMLSVLMSALIFMPGKSTLLGITVLKYLDLADMEQIQPNSRCDIALVC